MTGIKASNSTIIMGDGDTSPDNQNGGYSDDDEITLSTFPAGTNYTWTLTKPKGATSRADLSGTDGSVETFTPNVGGVWLITAIVDGTSYQLRATVVEQSSANATQTIRYQEITDTSVPTPGTGGLTEYKSDQYEGLSIKLDDGSVVRIPNTDTGEANTASNVGSGADIFKQKTGVDLEFLGVAGTNDIATAVSGDNIEVSGAALLPLDGDRPMTDDLDMGANDITNVGLVDGKDVSALDSPLVAARKKTAGTITKGSPVYNAGWNIAGYMDVEPADATTAATYPSIGLANENIGPSATGYVRIACVLEDTDTSSWNERDALFLDTTPGQLVNVRPTGLGIGIQYLGEVSRKHASNGTIVVNVSGVETQGQMAAATRVWESDGAGTPQEVDPSNRWVPAMHASTHETGGSDLLAHQNIPGSGTNTHAQIDSHIASTANPHSTDLGNLGTGTLAELNAVVTDANLVPEVRTVTAGAGQTGGGNLSSNITLNVIAHADGSITVNANDIQVGVLATDGQHGERGGGTQHADVTSSVDGFMIAADKVAHDAAVELNTVSKEKSGIAEDERTDSTMVFNDAFPRRFSIAPAVTNYDIWIKGVKTTKSGTETVDWTDVEGIHFFYFNSSGTLTHSVSVTDWVDALLGDGVTLAALYWDAANNVSFLRLDERHGLKMDGATHRNLHLTRGTQWITGGALGDIIADGGGGLDTHAQLSVETVTIEDEDLSFTFSEGSPQTMAVPAQIPIYYRDGVGGLWRKRTANTFPMIYSGDGSGYVGGSGRVPYNLNTAGTWSLSEVGNNNFVLVHFFATSDVAEPIIAIQGQVEYSTIISARTGATTEINSLQLGQLAGLAAEHTELGTIILQTNGGYANTPNCQIRTTDLGADYVDFRRNENVGNAGGATDHDSLSGVAASTAHTLFPLLDGTRIYTADLDVGGFDLNNVAVVTGAAAADLALNAVTGQEVLTTVNGVTELAVSATVVDAQSNTIRTTGVYEGGTNPATSGDVRLPENTQINATRSGGSGSLVIAETGALNSLFLGSGAATGPDFLNLDTTSVGAIRIRSGSGGIEAQVSGVPELTLAAGLVDAQNNTVRSTGPAEFGTNPATAGTYRGPNTTTAFALRNNANSANVTAIGISTSDEIEVGLAATVKLGDTDMNGNDIDDVGLATSNAEATASSSSNVITLPFNTSNVVKTTLTENITTINVTAPASGVSRFQWRVTQAAGSSYTLGGWAAAIDWGAAGAPTMTTDFDAWDIFTFWYDGTNWSGTYAQGFGV